MNYLPTSLHRNKENEPSSLNGTAPPRRCRRTAVNPYETRKKVPTPFALNEAMNSQPTNPSFTGRSLTAKATTSLHGSNASSSLSTIEEEDSPIIKRILEKTGCSSRQELLAKRSAQVNTNGSKVAPKAAPNGSKNATNPSTAANATNRAKSTNGSKATNPKKKAKSKQFY